MIMCRCCLLCRDSLQSRIILCELLGFEFRCVIDLRIIIIFSIEVVFYNAVFIENAVFSLQSNPFLLISMEGWCPLLFGHSSYIFHWYHQNWFAMLGLLRNEMLRVLILFLNYGSMVLTLDWYHMVCKFVFAFKLMRQSLQLLWNVVLDFLDNGCLFTE